MKLKHKTRRTDREPMIVPIEWEEEDRSAEMKDFTHPTFELYSHGRRRSIAKSELTACERVLDGLHYRPS